MSAREACSARGEEKGEDKGHECCDWGIKIEYKS